MIATETVVQGATLDDLMRYDGKAELIRGEIVPMMASGYLHGIISKRICRALDDYESASGKGVALPDCVGYAVKRLYSGRESFSPDASYHVGPKPINPEDFIPGAPVFAVEIRSKGDYGPQAEFELAAKRADYFEAGTLVVWDVDTRFQRITRYQRSKPYAGTVFEVGTIADAEPALPGWRVSTDVIFR